MSTPEPDSAPRTGWAPALAVRDYRLWWIAQIGVNLALQMTEVAIGWQVYAQHGSTLDLGLIGLAEFAPLFILALPAGHLVDHLPRRLVLAASLLLSTAICAGLAAISLAHVAALAPYLALAVGTGVAMALQFPSSGAMVPTLVAPSMLTSAMSMRSVAMTIASVVGPAMGGLLFAVSAPFTYGIAAAVCLVSTACVLAIVPAASATAAAGHAQRTSDLRGVLEGLRYVRRTPILLGAILLDLLGVLFGGAVGLLPVFAAGVLHVGPVGLGALRASTAIGALLGAAWVSRRPLQHDNGRVLLIVVAVFGVCTIVFGLSHSFTLSMVALGASGFADLFSVQIRSTLSALTTPETLRGRVGAVEMVFVSASNELGTFESGLAASFVGAVPTVVGGGVVTVAVALTWKWLFPTLARVDRLEDLVPEQPLELA